MLSIISHSQDSLPPLAAAAPANVFALTIFRYEIPQPKIPQTKPPVLAGPDLTDVAGTAHTEIEKRKKKKGKGEKRKETPLPLSEVTFPGPILTESVIQHYPLLRASAVDSRGGHDDRHHTSVNW